MALIKCRECGQVISDMADHCPKCGCPVVNESEETQYGPTSEQMVYQDVASSGNGSNNNNKLLYAILAFLVAIIIGGGIFYFIDRNNKMEKALEQQQQQHVADSLAKDSLAKAQVIKDSLNTLKAEAQPRVAPQPRVVTIDGYHHLKGAISKYGITMDIQVNGGYVEGTYYYHSQGRSAKMTVYGNLSGSQLHLEEYNPDGDNTGCFDGTFNGYSYSGGFQNYMKGTYFKFNVVEK